MDMNKILIVEDDETIIELMRLCLSKNGYICATATDGMTALDLVEAERFDLILLDIMLPGYDGYELLEYIKQFQIPTIFVTAKSTLSDKVKGLRLGAEDYIVKPFELQELLARVETVLRRYNLTERIIKIGKITIDTTSRAVTLNGEIVPLPLKEYELLLYLVKNKNIALYRESIYENVWKEPYYGNTRTIDLHIQRLKKKLDLGDAIEAVYKVGYKFNVEKLI